MPNDKDEDDTNKNNRNNKNTKILLVDDEPDIVYCVMKVLEDNGFVVDSSPKYAITSPNQR